MGTLQTLMPRARSNGTDSDKITSASESLRTPLSTPGPCFCILLRAASLVAVALRGISKVCSANSTTSRLGVEPVGWPAEHDRIMYN